MTEAPKTPPFDKTDQTAEAPGGELDAASLSAIRSILTEQDAPASKPARGRSTSVETAAASPVPLPRRKADGLPELEAPIPQPPPEPARKFTLPSWKKTLKPTQMRAQLSVQSARAPGSRATATSALLQRLKAYRPARSHVVIAALLAVVVLRPWLVLGLLILTTIIMIGVFLMVGFDGFWHGVMRASRWYAKRRPSRAAAVHAKLDSFAMRWDAVLDRFPEGTVDSLYLPDFSELASADARHDAAVERRLAGLSGKGA